MLYDEMMEGMCVEKIKDPRNKATTITLLLNLYS